MIFIFGYGWGVLIVVLLVSLLIPRNSKAWPFIMLGILALDLVLGSILFAAIQGGLLWYYYSQRRQQRPGPAGSGPGPAPRSPRPVPDRCQAASAAIQWGASAPGASSTGRQ